jgi:hypothetical protein
MAKQRASKRIDTVQAKDQLDAMQSMLRAWGMKWFLASMIWILTKLPSEQEGAEKSRMVPFVFNRVQEHLYPRLGQNNRVLKDRQGGYTTFFLLVRLFVPSITEGGVNGLLISQNSKYAAKHFQMVRRAHRLIGAMDPRDDSVNGLNQSLKANLLHTEYSNRHELVFDYLDSRLIVESAEVEEAAQGVTLHHVVSSETARWPGDPEATTSNIKGALVPGGTYDEESTANGLGGYFCESFLSALDDPDHADAKPQYYSWWWSDDYTMDLSEKQKDELEKDLTAEEYSVIRKMHRELDCVA